MKVLHLVEQYYPSLGGMQEVVKRLSEEMVKNGIDVTVATSSHNDRNFKALNGVKIEDFSVTGNLVYSCTGEVQKYLDFLEHSDFDVIAFFAAQQWTVDLGLLQLDRIRAKKVFVPTGFSGLFDKNYALYFERMKSWIHKFDSCVFLSDNYQDFNFYKSNNGNKDILIPNGACFKEFTGPVADGHSLLGVGSDYRIILHVGSHTSAKGHKEALTLFSRIPDEKYVLVIAGNVFNEKCYSDCLAFAEKINSQSQHKKVIVQQFKRDEILALYRAAALFLFPSNIECSPIVLYECMASKTPVLCSDAGNSREILKKGCDFGEVLPGIKDINGYIIIDIEGSERVFKSFLDQLDIYTARAEKAHEVWLQRYTWEKITAEYIKLYKTVLQQEIEK